MKKTILALILTVGAAFPAFADPVEGMWKTEVDDGNYAHIDIHMCGAKICGTIVKSFNSNGEFKSANQGKDIIIGMVPNGNGKYAGNVWRPSNNKTYVGKLELKGNKLKMKGCVAGGLICSSQTWNRLQ